MARQNDDRFIIVYQTVRIGNRTRILADKTTGVQYILHQWGMSSESGAGLTVLVDQDGKPLLYQPPEE